MRSRCLTRNHIAGRALDSVSRPVAAAAAHEREHYSRQQKRCNARVSGSHAGRSYVAIMPSMIVRVGSWARMDGSAVKVLTSSQAPTGLVVLSPDDDSTVS